MDIWGEFFTNRKKLVHDVKLMGIPCIILFSIIAIPFICVAIASPNGLAESLLMFSIGILLGIVGAAEVVGAILFGIPTIFKLAWRYLSVWSLLIVFILFGLGVCYGWLAMNIVLWRDYAKFKTSRALLQSLIKDSGLYDTSSEDVDSIITRHTPEEYKIHISQKQRKWITSFGIILAICAGISILYLGIYGLVESFKGAETNRENILLLQKYDFEEVSGGYSIIALGTDLEGDIVIPDTYDGRPIVTIGKRAFVNSSKIVSITMPDTILEIGESAFANCTALETIRFSQNLEHIALGAFSNCDSLEEIQLPNSLIKISRGMIVSAGAFEGCDSLKVLRIGNGLKNIEYHMFADCAALESIYIPVGLETIGTYTFDYNNNIKHIYFDGTIQQWRQIEVDNSAFTKQCQITVHCSDGDVPLRPTDDTNATN